MSRYYCPFCSSRNQFHKSRSDGVLICGQCGDPLMKKPLVDYKRVFGMITTLVFLTPLLIMIILLINNFTNEKPQNSNEFFALLAIDK
tara:strand:+ start:175 stop:438 length:264 start_codon:yes stop_codon:yes gene_type:complete